MRGEDKGQGGMFSYVRLEQRVPATHPLRTVRQLTDVLLDELSPQFERLYAKIGRPSIPPEQLLRALLLQALYSIRSERMLMEQLDYNLLFRWFVGRGVDDSIWDATVFCKNRDRLLEGDIARSFFSRVRGMAQIFELMSDEHFTVDGTLIEAWAGQKSFQRKDESRPPKPGDPGSGGVDFRGERRSNQTHQSTTDPDARLYRKSHHGEAKLCYLGHALIENRHGLVVDVRLSTATGTAECEAAADMMKDRRRGSTMGADKAYDTAALVRRLRDLGMVPHVAQNTSGRRSAIDVRTTRHPGYSISQKLRYRVERLFAWCKTVAQLRKTRHRGRERVEWMFTFIAAAYNLVRMRNILAAPT